MLRVVQSPTGSAKFCWREPVCSTGNAIRLHLGEGRREWLTQRLFLQQGWAG